jgi:hypothetical protein
MGAVGRMSSVPVQASHGRPEHRHHELGGVLPQLLGQVVSGEGGSQSVKEEGRDTEQTCDAGGRSGFLSFSARELAFGRAARTASVELLVGARATSFLDDSGGVVAAQRMFARRRSPLAKWTCNINW